MHLSSAQPPVVRHDARLRVTQEIRVIRGQFQLEAFRAVKPLASAEAQDEIELPKAGNVLGQAVALALGE